MLVVSDIDDVFLPKPTDLLVNLAESRSAIENLLGRLNDMFQDNTVIGSALGPALQAAFKLMVRNSEYPFGWNTYHGPFQSHIGGKIVTLSSSLPTIGAGALKNREDPKILGTSKVVIFCVIHSNFRCSSWCFRNQACCSLRRHSTRHLLSSALELKSLSTCSCSALHTRMLRPWVSLCVFAKSAISMVLTS